ncbi:MAG: nucleoside-diphosphate kinase [Candidatus Marinimicrobia bacterium]|nr:nucleoside-diphosphate kinase [Candidatus Neomarinimicrobiota bacterium]
MVNITLAIIKPDAMAARHQGKILDRILQGGFNVRGSRIIRMSKQQAEGFYEVHRGKPFFEELTAFMSSGPTMPLVLEKDNAVADFRDLIGVTNPADAAEGTIRKDFAASLGENAVHGSDSDENAEKEVAFFFARADILGVF